MTVPPVEPVEVSFDRPRKDAADAVTNILATNNKIKSIELKALDLSLDVPQGLPVKRLIPAEINQRALSLREATGAPFWAAVMTVAADHRGLLPESLFRAATFHRDMDQATSYTLEARDLTAEDLRTRVEGFPERETVMLSSRVTLTDGSVAHIPMLDMKSHVTESNTANMQLALGKLGYPGVLMDSGRSYHFYGNSIISEHDLPAFLGGAILLTPLVDHRWIGHQLLEGSCALRLSRSSVIGVPPRYLGDVFKAS